MRRVWGWGVTTDYPFMTMRDMDGYRVELDTCDGRLSMENCGSIDLDRTKARELAAILTNFADTGELPNDGEGSHDDK